MKLKTELTPNVGSGKVKENSNKSRPKVVWSWDCPRKGVGADRKTGKLRGEKQPAGTRRI